MTRADAVDATPLQHALDGFSTALDHLVKIVDDGGVDELDAHALVGFAQDFEAIRNRMSCIDHVVIRTGVDRDVPHSLCQRNMGRVLAGALRLAPAEAARRVRVAEHLADRSTMCGQPLPPWRPHLAAAQRRGEVTPDQAMIIDQALREVDGRGFDPTDIDAGEQILVDAAGSLKPAELRDVATKVVDAIDPDGTLPDDRIQRDRRFFHLRRAADGSFRGEFRLTAEAGARLKAVLDPLAGPKITAFPLGDEGGGDAGRSDLAESAVAESRADDGSVGTAQAQRMVEPDLRTRGQRMHDALEMICSRLLRSDSLPDSGGTPATVVITIDAEELRARTGVGFLTDGSPISAASVIELADQADVAWCVKNSRGAVLSLGRVRRLASRNQTLALIARDGGCSFPGCDMPQEWSERHHIVPWVDGGPTDLDNLTLLCSYHHHNFAGRGWACRLNRDRLPTWIPPKWIDRQQRPILHTRIRVRRWRPQQPLPDSDGW